MDTVARGMYDILSNICCLRQAPFTQDCPARGRRRINHGARKSEPVRVRTLAGAVKSSSPKGDYRRDSAVKNHIIRHRLQQCDGGLGQRHTLFQRIQPRRCRITHGCHGVYTKVDALS
jgi:hypothetical protein